MTTVNRAMELQNFVTLQVHTLDPNENTLTVAVPAEEDEVSVDTLHGKVCDTLGLKKSSQKYFCLCQGLPLPIKKYKVSDSILVPATEISFQKWSFDPTAERKLLKADSQAVHFLFLQARHDLDTGKLQPSKAEKLKLEECLEPSFVMEEQYVSLCQKLEDYHSVRVQDCQLTEGTVLQGSSLPRDTVLCIYVSKHGLKIKTDNVPSTSVSWFEVMKWSWNERETTLTYSIQHQELSAPVMLCIASKQAEYLLAATLDGVWALMADDEDSPMFHASMIVQQPDGSKQWTNCIFDPSKALKEQTS